MDNRFAVLSRKRMTKSPSSKPDLNISSNPGVPIFLHSPTSSLNHGKNTANHLQTASQTSDIDSSLRMNENSTPLPPQARSHFESELSHDFSSVRLHTGQEAEDSAQQFDAQAYTYGNDIVFNKGRYSPTTTEGMELLAHELIHVKQQNKSLQNRIQCKKLSDATTTQQKKLSVPSGTIPITDNDIKPYFEKLKNKNWGTIIYAPSRVSVELSGIDVTQLTPMTSIAMHMANVMTYQSPVTGKKIPVFGPGKTLNVFLALAKYGLTDGVYRFSWVGNTKTGTIYIESSISGPKDQNTLVDNSGTLTLGSLSFEYTGTWSSSFLTALKKALQLTPEAALKKVDKLKFKLKSGASPNGEAGHYNESAHTVVIFKDEIKKDDASRIGVSNSATYAILHEIGHAIDLAPLRSAWAKYSAGGTKSKLTKAKSEAGSKWKLGSSGKYENVERIKKIDTEFRKAAKSDGISVTKATVKTAAGTTKINVLKGGTTEYANKNWTELYADSFSLYVADPDLLALIRPGISAYFTKKFARKP